MHATRRLFWALSEVERANLLILLPWNKRPLKIPCKIDTAKSTIISPNFLLWKFCGSAQFPQSFWRITRNYEETVPFRKISIPENDGVLRSESKYKHKLCWANVLGRICTYHIFIRYWSWNRLRLKMYVRNTLVYNEMENEKQDTEFYKVWQSLIIENYSWLFLIVLSLFAKLIYSGLNKFCALCKQEKIVKSINIQSNRWNNEKATVTFKHYREHQRACNNLVFIYLRVSKLLYLLMDWKAFN